jgi:hypothetical protein
VAIDRIYYCEGPDCGGEGGLAGGHTSCHVQTATAPPYLPPSFIEVREGDDQGPTEHHFCSWDCLMKYAAAQPIPERIDFDGPSERQA